ncbi:DUF1542 domain-containing protein [Streptococcus mitis]|uniref:Gram positive anchor n=1 Tax=Streptococcus mitis SK1073 TaxID=1008452 RepID=F9HDD2_STRMT|nr:DUF1542 domain-containing protein [Streptococcus mitis]EGP67579.1 gram positive anchor [Streptococcus mitis SK1073]
MFHKGKYDREKQLRFSIRKVSFGAASVAVAALFMFLGNGAVSAAEQGVPSTNGETQALQPKDQNAQNGTYEGNTVTTNPAATVETNTQPSTVEKSPSPESAPQKVETLDKKELTDLIKEVDGKFAKGTYSTKTEESANNLRSVLEEARTVLSNAKTQAELSQAQAKLVTATTKLQKKPEEKKEVAAVDTTNGKATVGKKATNTEKSSESNSIANSGSKDKRNGKVLDTNNPFRTDAATTDTDPAANQTYTAPAADANLETLTKKLKTLPNYIENNKKVQDMDTLGNEKGVAAGSVAEITEFGGWKAVNQEDGSAGKFAIAKVTDKGVFPVETMNILGSAATAYVGEQSFDRTSKYMLFLSEVRTQATKIKEAYDNSAWSDSDGTFGKHTSKAVKGYNGIEKTFKVYSSDKNTKVNLEFKTGFSGHLDHPDGSSRANYKVEVFSIDSNNSETKVYEATFDPSVAKDNDDMKITPAKDSTSRRQSFNIPKNNKEAALEEFAKDVYKPYATGGTFTAKNINLPAGASSYKVRISTADNGRLGLDYHSNYESYALPVTGLDFNIDQDTGAIAKDLLSRIYDKLKATESADTDGKTNETKAAYLAELENIKTLVTSTDVKKTVEYKEALEAILSKQLALKVDKTGLTDSKALLDGLVNEDPTPGKTQDTAAAYNATKQEAIKAIEAAKTVIDNENATVAQVREALAAVNTKKTALQQAKDGLIEAATVEEKAKLKSDADLLTKADETGKTPESIKAYNRKYEALKAQLEAAKTEAATVLAKADNASKAEVQAAQTKVDAAKAELTKAAELLVNKADKTELTQAKEALSTLATEADPTTGKTADSAKAYNDAKTDAQEAIKTAETVINDENATPEQVTAALNKVNEKKTALQQAKDGLIEAATVEEKAKLKSDADLLTKADETGKTPDSIAVYERKYEELKAQLEETKAEADKVLAKGNNATKEEVKAAQEKVDAVKTELETAKNLLVEAATTEEKTKLKTDSDALKKADTTGKTADSIKAYEAEFEKLKAQLEEAKAEADKVLAKGNNATKEEVKAAQAKVDAAKTALDKAAESLKDLDRDAAKKEIADAAKKATDAIEASTSLTPEQKADEKAKVAKEAKDATDAIDNATTEEGINSAKENGKLAIEKEAAISAIKATKEAKLSEIDKNTSLSDDEKAASKAEVAKVAIEAVEAIQKAETQEAVNTAQSKGETAIKAVNPVGKEKALDAIQKAAEEKIAEIDKNAKLSAEEKAASKAEVAKAAIEAVEAIQKAETQEAVNAAQAKGEAAIKAVNPVGKEKALEAIQTTTEAKLAEIDKNTSLSAEEKAAAKAEVAKAAIEAVEAIQKAATQEAVDAAQTKGETAIKAVNPVGKEKALEAIQTTTEAKLAEIDKNTSLSAEEKAASKAEVAKAAIEAVEAIQKATTQEAVNAAQAKGEAAIKAVNPVGKEKALDAIQKVAEEKIAEIDKNDKLSSEEKAASKAEVAKVAIEAVEAIQKAATQEAVNEVQAKGETAIKAVNPVGKATAKAAIDKALAEKEKAIDARTDLTDAEKEVAKKSARAEAESAKKAIDNATDSEAVEKALRTFLYQIDQESLVYNRPTFNLEAYIQASITGVVKVERGKAITQADIISKLSLPENVTVISIDLPDTNTLGDKFAKVMLRLPDGTEVTVKVPVRVVASQNGDSKPETALPDYGRNNGATNTETKVDKAKLEGAIRQLDELIIQESTRLDAATALLAEAKAVFANAKASQAEVDAMVKRIEDFMAKVASSTNHATSANDQADQTPAVAPATTQVANASQTASAQANARTATKELPNTGTADSTVAMVAAVASALLGLGLAGRRRKEDEEA